jgi:hypothetical protein
VVRILETILVGPKLFRSVPTEALASAKDIPTPPSRWAASEFFVGPEGRDIGPRGAVSAVPAGWGGAGGLVRQLGVD